MTNTKKDNKAIKIITIILIIVFLAGTFLSGIVVFWQGNSDKDNNTNLNTINNNSSPTNAALGN